MIAIRKAMKEDEKFLLDLRNERYVRQAFWNTDFVDPVTHKKWFATALANSNLILYMLEDMKQYSGKALVGQVRYDIEERTAVVSVSVMRKFSGLGYATEGLLKSSKLLFEVRSEVDLIVAHIKKDNVLSLKAFARAGYKYSSISPCGKPDCREMIFTRPR